MIVLVRHARTDVAPGLCLGRTEVRLSPEGEAQARELADGFADAPLARLYASPALRAVDTAAPLAGRLGLEVRILPELDEIDMGAWDGVPFATIRAEYPEEYARRGREFASFRAPGGESFADVADRAMRALSLLAQGVAPVLAVTHAGVIRSVLCKLTGHPLDDLFHFSPGHCRCTLLAPVAGGFRVVAADASPVEAVSLLRG